jgi:polyhydroxyalkanoate synthesis regulator phasin
MVDHISSLTGIPVKNVRREIDAVINTINTASSGTTTSGSSLGDAIKKALKDSTPVWGWFPDESKTDKLYNAIISGDEEYRKRIESGYKDQDAINSAIKKALRENDPRIKEAAQARYGGDIAEYMRIAKEIIAEGHFDQDTVVGAINAEISAIKRGEEEESTAENPSVDKEDEVTSIYMTSDINAAFESGDTAMAKEIIADLVKTKVANGKTEKEAKSSLRSSMTSYWKPLYKNADSDEKYRIRKILRDSGLYGNTDDVIRTCRSWLKDD